MRCGNEPFWFSEPGTDTAAISAKRALTAEQTLGAQAKNVSSAISSLACATFQHTSPTDFVIGA